MLKLHKLFRYSKRFWVFFLFFFSLFVLVRVGGAVISMEIYHAILSPGI